MEIVYIGRPGDHLRAVVARGDDVCVLDLKHIDYEAACEKISEADEAHIRGCDDNDNDAAAVAFYLGLAAMFKWSKWNPDFKVVIV